MINSSVPSVFRAAIEPSIRHMASLKNWGRYIIHGYIFRDYAGLSKIDDVDQPTDGWTDLTHQIPWIMTHK